MVEFTRFVGLDVHKDTIAIAVAEAGREAARALGVIAHDVPTLLKRLSRLGPVEMLQVAYEAGPTGYGLQRRLAAAGIACVVVAPSRTPRRSGDRVKTDRRDAILLAHYLRSGDLQAVGVPDERTEALRDLSRARTAAKRTETVAKHQLGKFLLRHDRRWSGKCNWTASHLAWVAQQAFEQPAQQAVLVDHLHALQEATARVERLTGTIAKLVPGTSIEPLVTALQALRGVQLITAVTLATELGDLKRFRHPRQLMGFVGLVPSESSTGERIRRGRITRTGNGHVRTVLVEAAWAYRLHPSQRGPLARRQAAVSGAVRTISWEAQRRLHGRYRRLAARGKDHRRVVIAVARELATFVWAIGQEPAPLAD